MALLPLVFQCYTRIQPFVNSEWNQGQDILVCCSQVFILHGAGLQHAEILEIFSVDQDESKDEKELIRLVDSTFSKGSSNGGHKG